MVTTEVVDLKMALGALAASLGTKVPPPPVPAPRMPSSSTTVMRPTTTTTRSPGSHELKNHARADQPGVAGTEAPSTTGVDDNAHTHDDTAYVHDDNARTHDDSAHVHDEGHIRNKAQPPENASPAQVAWVDTASVPCRHIGDRDADDQEDRDDRDDRDDQDEVRAENIEPGSIGRDDHHTVHVAAGALGSDDLDAAHHHPAQLDPAHLDPAHLDAAQLDAAIEPGYNDDGQAEVKEASTVRCLHAEADGNDHHRPDHCDRIAYNDVPARHDDAGHHDGADHYYNLNAAAALQARATSARHDDHRDHDYDHRSHHDNDSPHDDNHSPDDHDNGLNDYHDSPPDYYDGGNHDNAADHHYHSPADHHNHTAANDHHLVTTLKA